MFAVFQPVLFSIVCVEREGGRERYGPLLLCGLEIDDLISPRIEMIHLSTVLWDNYKN